eukprot:gene28521-31833_t
MVALLGLIYGLSARELTVRTDRILRIEAARLRGSSAESLPDRIAGEVARSTSGLNAFALQSRSGEPIAGNLRVVRTFRFDHPVNIAAKPGVHGPLRVLAIEAPTGETILIARDIAPIVDLRQRILEILIGSGVAIVVLVLYHLIESIMTQTLTGLFDQYDDARRAVQDLEAAGVAHRDISIVGHDK